MNYELDFWLSKRKELSRYKKIWYQENKERIAQKRKENKEKITEKNKKYYAANKENLQAYQKEYQKEYIKKNKDKLKEYQKMYSSYIKKEKNIEKRTKKR